MLHRRAPLAALSLATLGLAVVARSALEPEATTRGAVRDPAWLPSGKMLRTVACGQRLLLADLYWLSAVQYVGETVIAKVPRWEALHPLAEIVTDLDPRFGYAYQVTGSNLAGLAHRYGEADRILEKGMKNLPERWSLPFVYATNKFLYEQDYAKAAEYARRAAEVGKRPHLALLAANLSALANTDDEYQAAVTFIDHMLQETDTPELKAELQERRIRVRTFQALAVLERAVVAHRGRTGRLPQRLADLVPSELQEIPADPSGGRFLYDPQSGAVRSSIAGPRAPLHITRPE
jgi:tetratricopeptide (TPR) repeat protein